MATNMDAAPPKRAPLGLIPDGFEIKEFHPFAYFDDRMDCIRVMILNRSVTEERKDDFLTLYRTNHASVFDPTHCGFCLKGIRHLFNELGLEQGRELKVAKLIDQIVKTHPHSTMAKILDNFPATDDLVVKWPQARLAA
jgi:hypothetical protein